MRAAAATWVPSALPASRAVAAFITAPNAFGPSGLQLVDDRLDLGLDVFRAHGRGQVTAQYAHLRLLARGRLGAARLPIDLDRLLPFLHLSAGNPLDQLVVQLTRASLLARFDQLALQQRQRAQSQVVSTAPSFDKIGLNSVVERHRSDCHTEVLSTL